MSKPSEMGRWKGSPSGRGGGSSTRSKKSEHVRFDDSLLSLEDFRNGKVECFRDMKSLRIEPNSIVSLPGDVTTISSSTSS